MVTLPKISPAASISEIVRAMPEEWKNNLRKHMGLGTKIRPSRFRWADGSGCLLGLALDVKPPKNDYDTPMWDKAWNASNDFLGNEWYMSLDPALKVCKDPWAEIAKGLE